MQVSFPTSNQWKSVAKNALITWVVVFCGEVSTHQDLSLAGLQAAAVAAAVVVIKTVEKFLLPELPQ